MVGIVHGYKSDPVFQMASTDRTLPPTDSVCRRHLKIISLGILSNTWPV